MKKSLIALAVAGAFAAPAFAATSNVDIYGVMNIAIQDTNADDTSMGVVDNVSRIGFKGSEDLGGGLKAIWQIETALGDGQPSQANGVGGGGDIADRNTFIGLSGGFGTALIGRHDTPYKIATGMYDLFGDTIGDYNAPRLDNVDLLENTHDLRSSSAIAYISPNFSGFTFAAAVVSYDDTGVAPADDSSFDAYSLALMYANGPLTASLAYQNGDELDAANGGAGAGTGWKVGAGYTFGDTTIAAIYEKVEGYNGTDRLAVGAPAGTNLGGDDRDSWQVSVKHAMGPITLKALYGQGELDNTVDVFVVGTGLVAQTTSADISLWAIGADYALSKRTTAYFVYANGDDDNDAAASNGGDVSGWNLGVKHSF